MLIPNVLKEKKEDDSQSDFLYSMMHGYFKMSLLHRIISDISLFYM